MAAANNMIAAEGEIGAGRDITTIVPGGFSASGAINGNLRPRAAAAFLEGVLGSITATPADSVGTPHKDAYDSFTPADLLPYYTLEKKVGTDLRSSSELLTLQLTDCLVNTFSMAANSAALSTFSAGFMTAGEKYIAAPLIDDEDPDGAWAYDNASNDLLVFHGGRIKIGDEGGSLVQNDQFMSLEVAINNNVQGDEYTIRPSRFVHSFTEGIRDVEVNMTLVFNDHAQYQQYTYGATGRTTPGYSLYKGQLDFILANWQLAGSDLFTTLHADSAGVPATNAQAIHTYLPAVVFAGFPIALASGRITVTTNGRAVKPTDGSGLPLISVDVRPTGAAW